MVLQFEKENFNMSEIDNLTIESGVYESKETESDADDCDESELQNIFPKTYSLTAEKALTLSKNYILHISCTKESVPKICVGLSNNICEIHTLSNSQINKIATLESHKSNIVNVKFASDPNLLYTGSSDCTIKLWDLRTPTKSVLEFVDNTTTANQLKPLLTFDVSPNNRVLCGGTEQFESDAFLLFWDTRNAKLLGGYWESHTDDITKVLFHPNDNNKLASGSTDGLVNVYNLQEPSEDDALLTSLNTESSVEQILWYGPDYKSICCVTHPATVQLWDSEEATPYKIFSRDDIVETVKRKSADHCYVASAHLSKSNDLFLLAGSNWHKGECVRAVNITNNETLKPHFKLADNKQRIRASWFNNESELLVTGGEQCILSVWQESSSFSSGDDLKMPVKKKMTNTNNPY